MPDSKFVGCKDITKLLKAQRKVLLTHLAEHKWFQHIADENVGAIDFVEKYGWIMREMYCGFACPDRLNCEWAKQFLPKEVESEEQKIVPDEREAVSDEAPVCPDDVGFGV